MMNECANYNFNVANKSSLLVFTDIQIWYQGKMESTNKVNSATQTSERGIVCFILKLKKYLFLSIVSTICRGKHAKFQVASL